MDTRIREDSTFGEVPFSTSFKELGLVTLRSPLDLNEPDRPAPLNFNSTELRLLSPSASAGGGSSTGHPSTEGPGGRKRVCGGSRMDCSGHSVICSEPTGHRFITQQNRLVLIRYLLINVLNWKCVVVNAIVCTLEEISKRKPTNAVKWLILVKFVTARLKASVLKYRKVSYCRVDLSVRVCFEFQ